MKARFALSMLARESRGARGRLVFFASCIALGVAAVVGVASLSSSIEAGIRASSQRLMAGDIRVEGRRELPDEVGAFFDAPEFQGTERADLREFATMASRPAGEAAASAGARSLLVELKVVEGAYPFYGEVVLDPPGAFHELLAPDAVVVAPEVLSAFGLGQGDELELGGARFRIAATVLEEPDRMGFSLVLGPRVFLSQAALERTHLAGIGNRVRYKALFKLPPGYVGDLDELEERIETELENAPWLSVQNHADAQPTVRRAIRNTERFLGLVALLSLLLGGVGVAEIVRTWIEGRRGAIATLRCLGLRPREILVLYVLQILVIALVGSGVGAALGALVPGLLSRAAPDLLPPELLGGLRFDAIGRGLLLGAWVAFTFALPPLSAVYRVSPARVLRSDVQPLPPPRAVVFGSAALLVVGIFLSALLQADDLELAAWFTGGLVAVALVFFGVARGFVALVGRVPRRRLPPVLWNGIANLARPQSGTIAGVIAMGLGILVVLSLILIELRLEDELAGALPEEAPTSFLVDIQPDQWQGVRTLLDQHGAEAVDSVPVVMARLAAVDGATVEELSERRGGGRRNRWVLTREQRLTYLDELPADNEILAGELWNDPERAEVSLEADYAEDLGATIGSTLVFDVQGVPIELVVSSIRSVVWQSFAINFFLVVEPGVLESAPQFRIAAARLAEADEQPFQDELARAYPNVTFLRIRAILAKILAIVSRLTFGIRGLGALTVVAGLLILFGAIGATRLRRAREVALLKTLGLSRAKVVALFAGEYALFGLVAGLLGALGAYLLAWSFLEHVIEVPAELSPAPLFTAVLAAGAFAVVAGLTASLRALATPPVACLRTAD